MTLTAILPAQAAKEVRALAPVWALAVAGIAASGLWPGGVPQGALIYIFGALALGAASIGQEYSHRTLGMLLAQPVDRRRLYWTKFAVLVPMTVALALVFTWLSGDIVLMRRVLVNDVAQARAEFAAVRVATALLPIVAGLLIAPWLTMVCRSTVAGVVFGFTVPVAILGAAFELMPGAGAFALTVAMIAIVVTGACAAVLGWSRFQRLEAVENGQAVQLPRWRRAAHAVPRHPVWMLVFKELHLQQLSFATVAASMVVSAVFLRTVSNPRAVFDVLTLIYVLLLTILIGALASAEERQLGTLDGQLLLPMAAWRQWLVKLTVVFGLALASAAAVPLLSGRLGEDLLDGWIPLATTAVVLTAGSLYVSSLCRNAMTAVVTSLVVLPLASAAFLEIVASAITLASRLRAQRLPAAFIPYRRFEELVLAAFIVTLVVLLTRLAYLNHRTSEWSGHRVLLQILLLVLFLAGWSTMISALPLFL